MAEAASQVPSRPEAAAEPLVAVDGLSVHLGAPGRPAVRAVDEVSLAIAAGESIGIVGESGGGKSTLGRAIAGLRPASAGTVRYRGADLARLGRGELRAFRRRVQMVFQDPDGSLDPRMRVGDTIAEPLDIHRLHGRRERAERVRRLLDLVQLDPQSASRRPHEFSGGQRQRIGIARALAVEPEFVVLDEPVSALDVSVQAQILNLLMDLRASLGLTYLFISHDLSSVRHLSSRVGVMYLGRLVEIGPAAAVFEQTAHPYTQALISAMPVANPAVERARERIILKGNPPSPVDPPAGCAFHPRCWLHEELGRPAVCREAAVPLQAVGPGHRAACHFWREALARRARQQGPALRPAMIGN
jgi:oligopeptide/dipeptide ABC transporter ATP-binding protein